MTARCAPPRPRRRELSPTRPSGRFLHRDTPGRKRPSPPAPVRLSAQVARFVGADRTPRSGLGGTIRPVAAGRRCSPPASCRAGRQSDNLRRQSAGPAAGRRRKTTGFLLLSWDVWPHPDDSHREPRGARRAMGRRGQGQDRRSAQPGLRRRGPLAGGAQRGAHRHRRRRRVHPAPDPVGHPASRRHLRHRQRRGGRFRRRSSRRSTSLHARGLGHHRGACWSAAGRTSSCRITATSRRPAESRLGAQRIGTTSRGIGPSYEHKAGRFGIRIGDPGRRAPPAGAWPA